ncbi:MAG: outer membrane lipoprotein-sorting protein [Desulforhopalus sp.]|jgi:outer membrane lipoprotein-sorting protein
MKFFVLPPALLLFIILVSSCPAADQGSIGLQSIQADFIQEKHLKILIRPLISNGTFTFQAPQSLRWEYRTPVPSVLLMHGGKIKKFVERDGQLVEDRGLRLDSMQVVLGQISNWLDGRFSDNDMFSVSFIDERSVLLTPKNQGLAGLISKIELKLADQKGLLDGVTIFEGPDSYTTMVFENRILNKEIPVSVFTGPSKREK